MVGVTAATAASISAPISGVSGAPAQSTTCMSGSRYRMAWTRWMIPFWRVIRPTNSTYGLALSTPKRSSASVSSVGA